MLPKPINPPLHPSIPPTESKCRVPESIIEKIVIGAAGIHIRALVPAAFKKVILSIAGPQSLLFCWLVLSASAAVESEYVLGEIPAGYHLQAYDDCGVGGHQPHALTPDLHTFEPDRVQADERARTVTFGRPNFDMVFENLAGDVPYVLAITYASEKNNPRVQSLSAGPVALHGQHRLPDGTAERLFFRIPPEGIASGKLILHFILNEGPNAVVSEVGLWAPLSSPEKLNLEV